LSNDEKFALISLQHGLFPALVRFLLSAPDDVGQQDMMPPFQELGFAAAGLIRNLAASSTAVQQAIIKSEDTLDSLQLVFALSDDVARC
jgi:hypothetical protein